jgi:hypothetical protein
MNKLSETLKKIIKLWPEIWAVPLVLFGFWISYYVFELIDPSAGTFDIGTLQALMITIVVVVVLNAFGFLGIEKNDAPLWKYYKDETGINPANDLNEITPWQRLKLLFFWRAFLFLLSVVIFQALI